MEKNRSRPPGQQRRPVVRLDDGRSAQLFQISSQSFNFGDYFRIGRQAARGAGVKILRAQQLHAVVGARLANHQQMRIAVAGDQACSLRRDEVARALLDRNGDE